MRYAVGNCERICAAIYQNVNIDSVIVSHGLLHMAIN